MLQGSGYDANLRLSIWEVCCRFAQYMHTTINFQTVIMAATRRSQQEMMMKCKKQLGSGKVQDPVERMRLQLLERGCNGIKAIGR